MTGVFVYLLSKMRKDRDLQPTWCKLKTLAMFPTLVKSKISSALAYPVKAKLVSDVLSEVPQAAEFGLWFYHHSTEDFRKGVKPYSVITVSYPNDYFTTTPEMAACSWTVMIHAVPRAIKHRVAKLIELEALPRVRDWLLMQKDHDGNETARYISLTVSYDVEMDALLFGEHQHA